MSQSHNPIIQSQFLYSDRGYRLGLNPLRPKTWEAYADFIASHNVATVSLHPPLLRECDRSTLETAIAQMQAELETPVYLEVMPSPEYWCSSLATLIDAPLLLDVSHVLIWHQGDEAATQQSCEQILAQQSVGAIHLSHNDGKSDRHDLIPAQTWFTDRIAQWQPDYLVTYESLPIGQQQFERLDKQRSAAYRHTQISG